MPVLMSPPRQSPGLAALNSIVVDANNQRARPRRATPLTATPTWLAWRRVDLVRIVSWNVNGIRACVRRGFVDFLDRSGADILGVQEVRALPEEIPPAAHTPPDWHAAFNVAERRGYSGVGIYSKFQPDRVETALGEPRFDIEGRFIAAHFQTDRGRFAVLTAISPKEAGRAGTTAGSAINSTSIGRYSTGRSGFGAAARSL